ncbi:MAG: prepilin-type N-terminal cleavage/methylation domain-containing protein [Candidatus Riflebacteria bacterium]|nr:prepilin-type N-terminal cleavage/methylation domain-containing protein [Candidatus Riflebacteria bacterium]
MNRHRYSAGVSLLEVVIALAIVAITAGFIYQDTAFVTRQAADGRWRQVARALAQRKLVETECATLTAGITRGSFGGAFPEYTWTMTIEPAQVRRINISGVFAVRLLIEWKEVFKTDELQVETWLTEYHNG